MGFGAAHAVTEEVGVASKVFERRQRDGIDPFLDRRVSSGGKCSDPVGECPDELSERVGRQRTVDPPVALSQIGVVVVRAQQDFERSRTTHDAGEVLGCTTAGYLPECRFELGEDRCLACGEPHVARQHEFAAGTTYAPFDLGDRDQMARAQVPEQRGDRCFAGQHRGLGPYSATRARSTCEMK